MPESRPPRPSRPAGPEAAPKADQDEALQGHIDGIDPEGWVGGWAVDVTAPHRHVEIRLLDGERLLAIGTADRPRADVKAAGFGDGFSGFSLVLPDDVFDGNRHKIRVVARSASSPPRVLGTIDEVLPPRSNPSAPRSARPAAPAPAPVGGAQQAMQRVRSGFVESALTSALARIDELERSHRAMGVQRDALQAQLRGLSERFAGDLNALAGIPRNSETTAYLGGIVRSLSLTRRRDMWLRELANAHISGSIYGTMPHDGAPGRLCVLVWGSGGVGDLLYLSTVVRELFRTLGHCQIFVLNEHPAVAEVFANNPYVSGTMCLHGNQLYDFVQMLHTLDVFDLVAEVRYCVTYTAPPLSRAPKDFIHAASHRSAEWQRYVRHQWPHLNNLFANEVMARGLNKLGLVGLTALLPIDTTSEIDFFVPGWYPDLMPELSGTPFATIHHGSDKKMSAAGGVQTKNLPTATWNQIARRLGEAGLKVVQLGESHEQLVEGVDVDLRGRTTLNETAFVLKMAAVHIDTEGGLVHLARAMNTRSVVAFGPTPVGFFGYPQNDNIAPPLCGNCWWTSNRWATQCPRDLAEPECMATQSAVLLADRALALAAARRHFAVIGTRGVAGTAMQDFLNATIADLTEQHARGAVVLGPAADPQIIVDLARPAGDVTFYLPVEFYQQAHDAFGHARALMPYSAGGISCNTAALDWALVIGCDPNSGVFLSTALEVMRCVRPGGRALLGFTPGSTGMAEDLRWTLDLAQSRQIGNKYRLVWPADIGGDLADTGLSVLFLEVAEQAEPAPELAIPDLAIPDLAIPDLAIPDLVEPAVAPPEIIALDLAEPEIAATARKPRAAKARAARPAVPEPEDAAVAEAAPAEIA